MGCTVYVHSVSNSDPYSMASGSGSAFAIRIQDLIQVLYKKLKKMLNGPKIIF